MRSAKPTSFWKARLISGTQVRAITSITSPWKGVPTASSMSRRDFRLASSLCTAPASSIAGHAAGLVRRGLEVVDEGLAARAAQHARDDQHRRGERGGARRLGATSGAISAAMPRMVRPASQGAPSAREGDDAAAAVDGHDAGAAVDLPALQSACLGDAHQRLARRLAPRIGRRQRCDRHEVDAGRLQRRPRRRQRLERPAGVFGAQRAERHDQRRAPGLGVQRPEAAARRRADERRRLVPDPGLHLRLALRLAARRAEQRRFRFAPRVNASGGELRP